MITGRLVELLQHLPDAKVYVEREEDRLLVLVNTQQAEVDDDGDIIIHEADDDRF